MQTEENAGKDAGESDGRKDAENPVPEAITLRDRSKCLSKTKLLFRSVIGDISCYWDSF